MAIKNQLKDKLHPKNIHRNGYNFKELIRTYPALEEFVFVNKYNSETIDFANAEAVKKLNSALLFKYYSIKYWDFPEDNLCPPIPGRMDYIHYLADLLKEVDLINTIKVLDIGVGANCIYPLLGNSEYGWNFVGSDVDKIALDSAQNILEKNNLSEAISLKFQKDSTHILTGILTESDHFSAAMCNPPFYKSQEDAMQANARKQKGLGKKSHTRNFRGKQQELWYKGGEKAFIHTYLYESSKFKTQCFWYSTLVSKKENVKSMYDSLQKLGATKIKTIPMYQGNKVTRIVAWTFLNEKEQKNWVI